MSKNIVKETIKCRLQAIRAKLIELRAKKDDADANYPIGQVEIGIEIDKLVAVEGELQNLLDLMGGDV